MTAQIVSKPKRLTDLQRPKVEVRWEDAIRRAETFPGAWGDDLAARIAKDMGYGLSSPEEREKYGRHLLPLERVKVAWGVKIDA